MREHLLYLVGAFIVWTQPAVDSARVILHEAQRAVEADSATRLKGRWEARLRQRPGDPGATLGLATLARLTYDYPTAARLYGALVADPAAKVATYAYVNPVVAVLLGWAFAGEAVTSRMMVAAAVIVGAVALITAGTTRPAAEPVSGGEPTAKPTRRVADAA